MSRLSITAILTTHRRPQLLLRALASLWGERRRPDEILVVEDGEDPATVGLLADSGVPCRLVQRTLFSVAKARNLGLREASGDWVIYLDDDDIVYEGRLAELEAAARRTGASFVFGSTLKVMLDLRYHVPTHHPQNDAAAGFEDILCCMPHTNSTLFSKPELLGCGGFVEASSYFSDWCAMLHLADRGTAWRIPAVLSEFETVSGGMTHVVAQGNSMKEKVLEAFDLLDLRQEGHRQLLRTMRQAVAQAEPFSSYDAYVEMASLVLSRP